MADPILWSFSKLRIPVTSPRLGGNLPSGIQMSNKEEA